MIKSLTLTIEEIRQLIEITNPEAQRQVLQSLTENAQEEINPDNYANAHPMALNIATKIHRKEKAAERRREKTKSATERKKEQLAAEPALNACENDFVSIDLNEATVNRLLWLKQNHALWLKAIKCIIAAINSSEIPTLIAGQLLSNIDELFTYLNPLIRQASEYHSTPRRFRPLVASAQVALGI